MTTLTPDEQRLDQHIQDCRHRMAAAFVAQDLDDARMWQHRMYDAMNSRTSEHRAQAVANFESAIWFQSPEALAMGATPP